MEEKKVNEALKGFLDALSSADNKKTASQLERLTGKNPRAIRTIVNALRKQGYPIASSEDGYWLAQSPEELEDTIARLNAQSSDMALTTKALMHTQWDMKMKLLERAGYTV